MKQITGKRSESTTFTYKERYRFCTRRENFKCLLKVRREEHWITEEVTKFKTLTATEVWKPMYSSSYGNEYHKNVPHSTS